jgi:acyl carrier protein
VRVTRHEHPLSQQDIVDWLVQRLARACAVPTATIDVHRPFNDYQFDSLAAVVVNRDLAAWLGHELPLTVFWDFPTIASLSSELIVQVEEHQSSH